MHEFQRTYKRGYFESKPDGVVRWDEVKYAVIGKDAFGKLSPMLQQKGIIAVEYDGSKEDRIHQIQQLDDRYAADYGERDARYREEGSYLGIGYEEDGNLQFSLDDAYSQMPEQDISRNWYWPERE